MPTSIIVIGAGMAGLSAGCYAQMNGFNTQIFEQHVSPGGVCTSWKRKGYTLDCCIHNLVGTRRDTVMHRIWSELGAFPERPVITYDEFVQVEDGSQRLTIYTDLEKLERHMMELSPADGRVIEELINAARGFLGFELFSLPVAGTKGLLSAVRYAPALMKWSNVTLQQFANRFADPFLRKAFPHVQYDFADIPMVLFLNFLAGMHNGDLGWPAGGSLAFSKAIAARYELLGGTIHYKSRVAEIIVKNDKAAGVVTADGAEHRADIVVSNADGRTTIFDMLKGRHKSAKIQAYYATPVERQDMTVHVSFGVNRDLSAEPHALVLFLEQPLDVMDSEIDRLDVELSSHDPSMSPGGKGVIKVVLNSSFAYWKELYPKHELYEVEKSRLAETIASALERRFPGFGEQVEIIDVATPMTFERYTGAWHGFQSWLPGEGTATLLNALRGKGWCRTLPGLKNFYMIGQWAGDVGLPNTATSGRNLVKHLCKSERRRFKTS
ncbi:MAG: phytoene desaturase family protein [Halobacteriota archaeon]